MSAPDSPSRTPGEEPRVTISLSRSDQSAVVTALRAYATAWPLEEYGHYMRDLATAILNVEPYEDEQ